MFVNELYLAVLPIIHMSTGQTEQVLTLTADRQTATEFFPEEVDTYINFFKSRADKYLIGGRVKGYALSKENTVHGCFVVRVTQNVE